jgi:dihydrofolate reductase
MMISSDGFIEGPNKELDYFIDDEELLQYFDELLDAVDLLIYGRKSYKLMISYWPDAVGPFAQKMNTKSKIVFSTTLKEAVWNTQVKQDVVQTINALKQQPGKDLVVFAGADMLTSFLKADLVDEFRLIVYPVALGSGTPLFKDLQTPLRFKLVQTRPFGCGSVLLNYLPIH